MRHTSIIQVDTTYSPQGDIDQTYLASGVHGSIHLWEEQPGEVKPESQRAYETVGYVIKGRAEFTTP